MRLVFLRGIADLCGARLLGISIQLLFRRLWECRRMRQRMLRGETRGVFDASRIVVLRVAQACIS